MNIFRKYGTFVHELATMAQEVERRLGKAEVTGSIPVSSSVEEVRISVKFSLFLQYRKMLVT